MQETRIEHAFPLPRSGVNRPLMKAADLKSLKTTFEMTLTFEVLVIGCISTLNLFFLLAPSEQQKKTFPKRLFKPLADAILGQNMSCLISVDRAQHHPLVFHIHFKAEA